MPVGAATTSDAAVHPQPRPHDGSRPLRCPSRLMRRLRWPHGLALWTAATLCLCLAAPPAQAAPPIIPLRTAPFVDGESGRLTLLVGGHRQDGRGVRAVRVTLNADTTTLDAPVVDETLAEHALQRMRGSPTWRAPVAVGVVYLYVSGISDPGKRGAVPVVDGITSYVRQLPERVIIYPTPYSEQRQGRSPLSKDDIARISENPPLPDGPPNLGAAIRSNLAELLADAAPLKVMLIVTDGRDYGDPGVDRPADFIALGQQLRSSGVAVQVVSFEPEDDAQAARQNLRDLRDASAGFHASVQPEAMEALLDLLGHTISSVRRLQYELPGRWRVWGGARAVGGMASLDGYNVTLDRHQVQLQRGAARWALPLALGAGGVAAAAFGLLLMRRLRAGAGRAGAPRTSRVRPLARDSDADEADEFPPVLVAAHGLVERGTSADRAALKLAAGYPADVPSLLTVDPTSLPDELFPVFHTRAGRNRFEELKRFLSAPAQAHEQTGLSPALADLILAVLRGTLAPAGAADAAIAQLRDDAVKGFTELKLEEVAELLRHSSSGTPELASPKARGVALSIQDLLRQRTFSTVSVGWLVCAGGPMKRGQTLRLTGETSILGSGSAAQVRLEDPTVAPEHARIERDATGFALLPTGGSVSVDGQPVAGRRALVDGETLQVGRGQYIFKQASG